jgi:hypothetical protein
MNIKWAYVRRPSCVIRLQFIVRPKALKSEIGRQVASSRESNHKNLAGSYQSTFFVEQKMRISIYDLKEREL